ncbi:MAG: HipA domain-containing protein [Firmicutes bacterium]|uniref:HipA domain-containing protein n=1 Tax=Candidatus Onthovivens merdipullorum TaxID=2840889 RepID=A0A9D9DGC2_9BACL|nr:HipA domain-containing protein [Candidatus Onthovivens merdipullorum]
MGSTLFSKRFDQNKEKRIHYISALTLLNAQDGESSNYSYLDLVILIKEYSSDPNLDLLELYKRMIFNIITSNTDDHLRNHGFIISEDFKIRLSPLFDLNQVKNSYTHTLNIFSDMKEINLDNLINYSKYFNLSKDEGKKIIEEINMTIKDSLNTLFKIYSFNRFEKEYIHSSLKYIEN